MSSICPIRPIAVFIGLALYSTAAAQEPKPDPFTQARRGLIARQVLAAATRLFDERKWAEAEKLLEGATAKDSATPTDFYNLACAQARQGKTAAALDSLEAAVAKGFRQATEMAADADLASLRGEERFQAALAKCKELAAKPAAQSKLEPLLVGKEGLAKVGPENTVWLPQFDLFQTAFRFADNDPRIAEPAVTEHGKTGEQIRRWQKEGTAAGLFGILYDNRDGAHSQLPLSQFPQLTAALYGPEAKADNLDKGLAARFFFNRPTFGNSSTALTGGPFWRSQTRLAQVDSRAAALLYEQYVKNALYFYPEHRDYDAGRNGPDGYGDVYPANTPYVITSAGSSGSDQSFLHAVACTLAAFPPKTQELLIQRGLLMPTVQMILRRASVGSDAEYLTGKAHPVVFRERQLNVERMVLLAHEMQPDAVPPMIQLQVVSEDQPRKGSDYFEAANLGERIFDTPAAIARVWRTTARERRMILTAATSYDANNQPLKFHWAALQARPGSVTIKPLKEDGSLVELRALWHERFASADGELETNRIDIAAFAHNGRYYSAPGFVTFFCLDDEERKYDEQGRIASVAYRSPAKGGNYADPMTHTLRDWRDEYQYDAAGRLTGWTRVRGEQREYFTAHGHLISQKDDKGRARTARKVSYVPKAAQPGELATLEVVADAELLTYAYDGEDDRVGHIADQLPDAKTR
ncbi:MAG TPA: hypothetical protein VFB80_08655 [Pirellulaceae bacterium]|nr:hypothetical protein [Pirellulaceae bacterium]